MRILQVSADLKYCTSIDDYIDLEYCTYYILGALEGSLSIAIVCVQ